MTIMITNKENKDKDDKNQESKIRLNLILHGAPAKFLIELRNKGFIRSYSDGISQAVRLLHDNIIEEQLRIARFNTLEENAFDGRK